MHMGTAVNKGDGTEGNEERKKKGRKLELQYGTRKGLEKDRPSPSRVKSTARTNFRLGPNIRSRCSVRGYTRSEWPLPKHR